MVLVQDNEMALNKGCTHLVVYDLGMTPAQQYSLADGLHPLEGSVAVVPFNYSAYPAHVKRHGKANTFAWKPIIIGEVAESSAGFVVWLDIGDVVHSRLWRLREQLEEVY